MSSSIRLMTQSDLTEQSLEKESWTEREMIGEGPGEHPDYLKKNEQMKKQTNKPLHKK